MPRRVVRPEDRPAPVAPAIVAILDGLRQERTDHLARLRRREARGKANPEELAELSAHRAAERTRARAEKEERTKFRRRPMGSHIAKLRSQRVKHFRRTPALAELDASSLLGYAARFEPTTTGSLNPAELLVMTLLAQARAERKAAKRRRAEARAALQRRNTQDRSNLAPVTQLQSVRGGRQTPAVRRRRPQEHTIITHDILGRILDDDDDD